jgi:hypothetical protein
MQFYFYRIDRESNGHKMVKGLALQLRKEELGLLKGLVLVVLKEQLRYSVT